MKHQESVLQQACVRWFEIQYPGLADLLHAIPNGGKRSRVEASIMKGEGVRPGIPDLFLAVPKTGFHGLFIEMKYGKNGNSGHQEYQQDILSRQGYMVEVCRSIDEFMFTVKNYLR